ncbi:MAG: site-specific integrase [Rhodospirillales bacterium]|nr:site-specific integrase [Rhodospirillales bacterium]
MPDGFNTSSIASQTLTHCEILARIAAWDDLTLQRRRDLACAVRTAEAIRADAVPEVPAAAGDDPTAPPPFSCKVLNLTLWRRAASCYGLSAKRLGGIVSLIRYSLTRLDLHDAEAPLTPAWQALYDALPTRERRMALVRLCHYCAGRRLAPAAVVDDILAGFERNCRERQLVKDPGGLARRAASNWNWAAANVPGWPSGELHRAGMRDEYAPPLAAYPEPFQQDARSFLGRLAAGPSEDIFEGQIPIPGGKGPRSLPRALSARTVRTREDQIRIMAAALVASGRPAETLTGLSDLVDPPANAGTILKFHRQRMKARMQGRADAPEELRSPYLAGLAELLRQIARYHCGLPEGHVAQIGAMLATVKPPQQMTMSPKNERRLRALLEPHVYAKLLHLPEEWMRQASLPDTDPHEAARLAMYAASLTILMHCAPRRGDLVTLRIDVNLVRATPRGPVEALSFALSKSITGKTLDWPLSEAAARLLGIYMRKYRPLLAGEGNAHLFPNQGSSHRNVHEFAVQLSGRVEEAIGAEFNMHLARHFAAVRYLRAHPGHYEVVSRMLGHSKVDTTMRFYAGLETDAAARQANQLLSDETAATRQVASAAFAKRRGRLARGGRNVRGERG